MTRFHRASAAGVLSIFASLAPAFGQSGSATEVMRLGLRGVYFVENQGQWSDAEVAYGFKSRGLDIAFRESSFTMHLSRGIEDATNASRGKGSAPPRNPFVNEWKGRAPLHDEIRGDEDSAPAYEHLTLTVSFPGSNPVTPRGAQPQEAKFNYYISDDESRWASNVPSFGAIIYENLYDGVDLHIRGNDDGVLKYEFHVAPGADWNQIRIAYDGIESLCVEESGDLRITTSFGTLMDSAPLVWQEDADFTSRARQGVLPKGCSQRHARAGGHPADFPCVWRELDSRLRGNDGFRQQARQEAGSAPSPGSAGEGRGGGGLTTRNTIPARFELVNATTYRFALDGPVDPTRTLIIDPEIEWMYYLGGSARDESYRISVDGAGSALVTGNTNSTNFAEHNNSYYGGTWDAFALKVSPSGQLQWMTYLGGSGEDIGQGIAMDGVGNALVTGRTSSTDFAGRNNSFYGGGDAFALKISPSGQVQWMTYLGGRGGSDYGRGIAVDAADNALVAGETASLDFAGRNNQYHGGRDAFALKVSPSGQLQWMTYLGGRDRDYGHGIAVDDANNALVAGGTTSTNFAGRNNRYHGRQDAFALTVSPSGQLQRMIYVGGLGSDCGYGIAVDGAGNALVTGETSSIDFEGRKNSHHGGTIDAFALKVVPSGQIQWMRYLGGSGDDYGNDIAVDGAGNALVSGYTTSSTDFEGRTNSYHGGGGDAYLLKLRLADGPQLSVFPTCPSGGPIRIKWAGATPGGQVALIFARNTGSFIIPNNRPCAGTQLGLSANQIQLAFQGGASPDGSRTLNANAGPHACGGYLQLLDLSTCGTSNVARIE